MNSGIGLGFGILAANIGAVQSQVPVVYNLKGSTPECCKQYKSTSFYLKISDIQVHFRPLTFVWRRTERRTHLIRHRDSGRR